MAEGPKGLASGMGRSPHLEWRLNADGQVRTMSEAVEIARVNGVNIPGDVVFEGVDHLPPEETASYGVWKNDKPWARWESIYHRGKIIVSFNNQLLNSDEAITAIVAHEVHEIESLRGLFAERHGMMPYQQLWALISPNGNLHMQAWDEADRIVEGLRAQREEGRSV